MARSISPTWVRPRSSIRANQRGVSRAGIVQRGEWLVPLKRATDIPSKPPLFHWSAAAASLFKGELSEPTIRFPSAVYATLGVLFLYILGRKLFGGEVALLGGAILATTTVYQNQALSARVDMTLCFFVTMSLGLFYSLYRGFLTREIWYYVFFSLVGISVLAKGPFGDCAARPRGWGVRGIEEKMGYGFEVMLASRRGLDADPRRRLVRDRGDAWRGRLF